MSLTVLFAVVLTPLVAAYLVACFRDPLRYALPPYCVLIPFSSLIAVAPGAFGSLSSLLGLVLGVALVAQLVTSRRGAASIPAALPVWLAFLALSLFSIFWSIAASNTLSTLLVLASQVLLYAALVLTRFDQAALRRFGTSLMLGGVLVVGYGLAQITFLGGLVGRASGRARFGDDLLGANNQAAALLLPLAIAAARTLSESGYRRLLYAASTLLIGLGIIMTGSRGGLLSALVVLFVVLWFGVAPRALKAGLAGLAVMLLAVIFIVQPGGLGQRQLDRQANSSGRADIWAVGVHACKLYCLAGAGWGDFPVVYEEELASVPDARIQERGVAFEPHNIYLLAVIEIGVPGLLLAVIGLGLSLAGALRLPRALRAPPVAALVGTMVSSFFLSNLSFKFFWAVLAFAAVSETVAAGARAERRAAAPAALAGRAPAEPEIV